MLVLLAILSVLIVLLYYVGTKNFDYWGKRGVKHDPPVPFFGTAGRFFFQKISLTDLYSEMYWKYPGERFVGFLFSRKPALILRDPELIKSVMTTDFNYFYARGVLPNRGLHEPLLKNLFFADGDMWKLLRQRMTPAFSSGKLKAMFPLIVEKAQKLEEAIAEAASSGADVDMREVMARYTTDFIGAVGFGIDSDSMKDESSQFRKVGKRIFTVTKLDAFKNAFKFIFPETFKGVNLIPHMIEENIIQLMRGILKQRNYTPSARNDFVDQLIELKQKGKISVESMEHKNVDGTPKIVDMELDENLMAGQMFVFFAAGFETSSTATSHTLHQLAFHPEAQRRCQREIDEVLARYEGRLCYDAVKEMKYLDMCFNEGLRLFPSLGFMKRRCERTYRFPGTDFNIDPDVDIIIPNNALQRDPKYFDNPDEFIPERFENGNVPNFVYLPFGEGPRSCIGGRLGRMQSLAGLAAVLRTHTLAPGARAVREPPRDPTTGVTQGLLGGVPLRLVPRDRLCRQSETST